MRKIGRGYLTAMGLFAGLMLACGALEIGVSLAAAPAADGAWASVTAPAAAKYVTGALYHQPWKCALAGLVLLAMAGLIESTGLESPAEPPSLYSAEPRPEREGDPALR